MTTDLQERARRWLKNSRKCHTILIGIPFTSARPPDAFGVTSADKTHLIICVETRQEWESLKQTLQERQDYRMGNFRYILAPPGIISFSEIPIEWGFLEAGRHRVEVATQATNMSRISSTVHTENKLLIASLKRVGSFIGMDIDNLLRSKLGPILKQFQKEQGEKEQAEKDETRKEQVEEQEALIVKEKKEQKAQAVKEQKEKEQKKKAVLKQAGRKRKKREKKEALRKALLQEEQETRDAEEADSKSK